VIIVGEEEIEKNIINLKNLETKEAKILSFNDSLLI